jgi:hypothetical protein
MRTAIGFGLMLGATVVGGLHGQSASDFGGLKPGQVVRVSATGRSRFESRLGGVSGDPVTTLFAGAEVPFEAADVDSLWVRGRATWTGALVGAAVATPLSALFVSVVCIAYAGSEGDGSTPDRCPWAGVVLLSAIGGAGGALIGAGVGALVPKWRLRYARARPITVSPIVGPGRVGLSVSF